MDWCELVKAGTATPSEDSGWPLLDACRRQRRRRQHVRQLAAEQRCPSRGSRPKEPLPGSSSTAHKVDDGQHVLAHRQVVDAVACRAHRRRSRAIRWERQTTAGAGERLAQPFLSSVPVLLPSRPALPCRAAGHGSSRACGAAVSRSEPCRSTRLPARPAPAGRHQGSPRKALGHAMQLPAHCARATAARLPQDGAAEHPPRTLYSATSTSKVTLLSCSQLAKKSDSSPPPKSCGGQRQARTARSVTASLDPECLAPPGRVRGTHRLAAPAASHALQGGALAPAQQACGA